MIVLAFVVSLLTAGSPEIAVDVSPDQAQVGLLMTVTVTVSGEEGADCQLLEVPKMDGARLSATGGPSTQNMTMWSNGRRRQSISTRWQFELVPERIGLMDLPPFRFNCRGSEVASRPRTFDVAESPLVEDVVRLSVTPSDTEVYVGQVVHVEVAASVLEAAFDAIPRGSWYELDLPWIDRVDALHMLEPATPDCTAGPMTVNDGRHQIPVCQKRDVSGLKPRIVYTMTVPMLATQSGRWELPDSRFSVRLVSESRTERDPFDVFGILGRRRSVATRVVMTDADAEGPIITVRPTPTDDRPPFYTNAVGRFRLDAEAQPRSLRVGESCHLRLSLSLADPRRPESGNLELVEWPEFDALFENFRMFGKDEQESSRVRVLDLEISPKNERVTEIPALEFASFVPETGTYEIVRVGPLSLDVAPGGDDGLPIDLSTHEELLNDLETIRVELPAPAERPWPAWVWLAGAIAALAVVEVRNRLVSWRAANPALVARRGARRALERDLDGVDDVPGVASAFARYLSARFTGPAGGLTAEEAAARIDDAELADELRRIVSGWEAAYLGGGRGLGVEEARAEARRLADALEAES